MKVIKVSQHLPEDEGPRFIQHFLHIELSCSTLSTAIVELYKSSNGEWMYIHFGVLYFLLDKANKCYYLKLYTPKDVSLLWQHEIYKNFSYVCASSFFHMFEGDDVVFGVNFSDILEAHAFKSSLHHHCIPASPLLQANNFFKLLLGWLPKRSIISTVKISQPTNVKHITHVGYDCIFGEEANREIVAEIRKILRLHSSVCSTIYNDPEIPDYVNYITNEMQNGDAGASSTSPIQPPPISWSLENDLKRLSSIYECPVEAQPESTPDSNNKRRSMANAIAVAIASRNAYMRYDSESDSMFSFESD